MTVEEALEIVCSVLAQGRLTKVQEIVFRQSWEGASYQEIAINSDYGVGYITDVGSKLWKLLSKTFGRKVTKNNLHGVLKQQYITAHTSQPKSSVFVEKLQEGCVSNLSSAAESTGLPRQDWGEAIDVSTFYGRIAELATLEKWIVQDRCRLVALLGMGGIGKTALAASSAEQIQDKFQYVVWGTLRNALPVKNLMAEWILFLSGHQDVELSETLEGLLSHLMEYLRSSRCLLILDNAESILRSRDHSGRYQLAYEGYGQLLRRIADECHQSCLVLTSREKPIGLAVKEGKTLPVRTLHLWGLQQSEAEELFKAKGLVLAEEQSKKLIEYYAGNPSALKIATTTIQYLFKGDVSKFLEQGTVVYGGIWDLLAQQFNRLSDLEEQLIYHLASNCGRIPLFESLKDFEPTISYREVLEALESLQQRSLIEGHLNNFIPQPMIMEYIVEQRRFKLTEHQRSHIDFTLNEAV